mmetsp:Transcript_429/g.757  ORF Transcript_429/g.757 Transcript_429/m.757 type:complete len:94 (+) Transcript_429:372-653(+)
MRLEKKYVGKYLLEEKDSGDVRIVADVKYSLQQQCWYAETREAEVDCRMRLMIESTDWRQSQMTLHVLFRMCLLDTDPTTSASTSNNTTDGLN